MLEAARRNKFIAQHWIEAFNKRALERFLALYWNDAKHHSKNLEARKPETKGLVVGKDALRTYFGEIFFSPAYATLHYQPVSITANDDEAVMEYVRSLQNEEDRQVTEVLKILEGKITSSEV